MGIGMKRGNLEPISRSPTRRDLLIIFLPSQLKPRLRVAMSQSDSSFFERERDRLSTEITSVSKQRTLTSTPPNRYATGFRGAALIQQRAQSQARGGSRHDPRIRNHRFPMAKLPPADAWATRWHARGQNHRPRHRRAHRIYQLQTLSAESR